MYLVVKNLKKSYGEGGSFMEVLKGVDFSVEKGAMCVIQGTSGSGKSTLLNCIGGLEEADSGSIYVEDVEVCGLSREKLSDYRRANLGFVFQFYNLVPNLTVKENIQVCEYLTNKPLDLHELMDVLGLTEHQDKFPSQLSGGQQQRIAIARAIVNEPRLLLLDEPLGALDLKLRQDMQYELIRLKNELGITFIYVTHDQEEALTMSDTIVVMNQGYIQQIGSPERIYNEPENAFVADFIGDSNIIGGIMVKDRLVEILGARFSCVDEGFGQNKPVDVVIRPEDVELVKPEEGAIQGVVSHIIFKGVHYEMEVQAGGFEWLVHSTRMFPVGTPVGILVEPFNIQIMNKPESEDEEAVKTDE